MKAIDKLKKHFPQIKWSQENTHESIFGHISAPQIEKRINKDLYRLNDVIIFISSKMGGTVNNPPFRYAMVYQRGTHRPYRCKNWTGVEYNKLFVSGKDLNDIVDKLIKEIDLNKFFLPK